MLRVSSMTWLLRVSMPRAQLSICGRAPGGLAGDVRCIHLDRRQALAELIVQFARKARALLLFDVDQTAGELAPLAAASCRAVAQ